MRQRIINIYENLYNTKYDKNDKNIKINVYDTELFVNNKCIITLYTIYNYNLYININKECIYFYNNGSDLIFYNINSYRIQKQIYGHNKQIIQKIKYNNLINIFIIKNFSTILKNKSIYLNNVYFILYCSYYKYNYNYYIFYNNKIIDNNVFNKINIIKNWFFIYIIIFVIIYYNI